MVTQYDINRIGLDVEYVYFTEDMGEDDSPKTIVVFSQELERFIEENGLAVRQLDVDRFSDPTKSEVYDYLIDNFNSVAKQYFEEILKHEL